MTHGIDEMNESEFVIALTRVMEDVITNSDFHTPKHVIEEQALQLLVYTLRKRKDIRQSSSKV